MRLCGLGSMRMFEFSQNRYCMYIHACMYAYEYTFMNFVLGCVGECAYIYTSQ